MTREPCEWCPFSQCSRCEYQWPKTVGAQGRSEGHGLGDRTPERVESGHTTRVSPHLQQQAGDAAELDWSPTP